MEDDVRQASRALSALAVFATVALVGCEEDRRDGNEARAIGGLRTIDTAQRARKYGPEGAYAATLVELDRSGMIHGGPDGPGLVNGDSAGYVFRIVSASKDAYGAIAIPKERGKTGDRAFFVDQSGVIRYTMSGVPTERSTPLVP